MALGVVGRKLGMTRVFDDAGQSLPVTVIEVAKNRITAKKSVESDGYDSVQVTTCLLYTSPSPRDATLSRMPSSA